MRVQEFCEIIVTQIVTVYSYTNSIICNSNVAHKLQQIAPDNGDILVATVPAVNPVVV